MILPSACGLFLGSRPRAALDSLPNNKIVGWSKLKVFADDKINVTEKWKFVGGKVENIVGKGEKKNGYKHFLLFPHCYQEASFSRPLKVGIVWKL